MMALTININGETQAVNSSVLAELISELGYSGNQFAIAVNGEFVPKSTYTEFFLNQGDKVDIVAPIAGG